MSEESLQLRPRTANLSGRTFGILTVVSFAGYRQRNAYWLCLCRCGNSKPIAGCFSTASGLICCDLHPQETQLPRVRLRNSLSTRPIGPCSTVVTTRPRTATTGTESAAFASATDGEKVLRRSWQILAGDLHLVTRSTGSPTKTAITNPATFVGRCRRSSRETCERIELSSFGASERRWSNGLSNWASPTLR